MQLTVLNVVHPSTRVGPDVMEDSGRILMQLDAALNRDGHHSVVIAPEGSVVEGILVEMPRPSHPLDAQTEEQLQAQYRATIETLLTTWRFDVIHLHGFESNECLPKVDIPVVITRREDRGVSLNIDPGRRTEPFPSADFVENYVATCRRLADAARDRRESAASQQQSFAA